jgi:hypothetical protein
LKITARKFNLKKIFVAGYMLNLLSSPAVSMDVLCMEKLGVGSSNYSHLSKNSRTYV